MVPRFRRKHHQHRADEVTAAARASCGASRRRRPDAVGYRRHRAGRRGSDALLRPRHAERAASRRPSPIAACLDSDVHPCFAGGALHPGYVPERRRPRKWTPPQRCDIYSTLDHLLGSSGRRIAPSGCTRSRAQARTVPGYANAPDRPGHCMLRAGGTRRSLVITGQASWQSPGA